MKEKTRKLLLTVSIVVIVLAIVGLVVQAASNSGTVQTPGLTKQIPTPWPIASAGSDGTYFANDGEVMLYVLNKSGNVATVNVITPYTVGGLAVADIAFTVAASTTQLAALNQAIVGPFPPTWFNETSGTYRGQTKITVSGAVSPDVVVYLMGW